jgi:prolyl-tRNA synthetase
MALPVIVGKKTEIEKFAGANHTYCIEAMTQDLRAVQAGTSHHLGQNFAKAFDVQFQSREGSLEYVYATSWGVSTRLIGTLIMAHSDDKGLILPPRLAPVQVAIVPISRNDEARAEILQAAEKIAEELRNTQSFREPIRVTIDRREKETPGFKFNDWEMKGACIRIEVGPRDLEESAVPVVERDTGEKQKLSLSDLSSISTMLEAQQRRIYEKALALRENNTRRVDTWEEFEKIFDVEGGAGFVLAHWDGTSETEQKIAELTKATIRCIPLEPLSPEDAQPGKCVLTGKPSERRVVFAKSY